MHSTFRDLSALGDLPARALFRAFTFAWILFLIPASHAQSDTLSRAESVTFAKASQTDSLNWRARHKPARAVLLSALLPGAGQIYNRKYWKAPIAWGGLGLCAYLIRDNTRQYQRFRDGYAAMVDDDPATVSEFEGRNAASVRETADTYQKWRDQAYLALVGVYILNVVDASVDAHFVRFDVSEDLSMDVIPVPLVAGQAAPGLSLVFALR